MLIVTLQLKDEKGTYLIEKVVASVTLPVLEFSKRSSRMIVQTVNTYIHNVNASKKLYKQTQELRKLKTERLICLRLLDDNKRLRALLGLKYSYNYHLIGAMVIDTSAFSGASIITIDKGKNSGVRENCAVVDDRGIIGRVWKLFPNQSQVQLISDTSSGVGVVIREREVGGVLKGTGDLYVGTLNYIPNDIFVKKGDTVFTSGTDGIYPPDIFVGVVESVEKTDSFYLKIKVRYAAKLSALKELVVIVDKDEQGENSD